MTEKVRWRQSTCWEPVMSKTHLPYTPNFCTISDFCKDHPAVLSGLLLQALVFCQLEELVNTGHAALDGNKVRATASKHKATSYRCMEEKGAQLQGGVGELLRRAQEVAEAEDRRYGKDKRGDELSQELAFQEGRLERIREAAADLEARAQAEVERAEAEGSDHPDVPVSKARRNFTDPESRIMPRPGGRDFLPAYNCQAVVDRERQVIIAAQATNQTSDKQQAVAMVEQTIANVGVPLREASTDAGSYSATAVADLQVLGTDPFIAPDMNRQRVPPPAPRGRIPNHLSLRDWTRRKLQTKRGCQRYVLRTQTVEPVLVQIRAGRGIRQFLLRGLAKIQGNWLLICTGHNLLKPFHHCCQLVSPSSPIPQTV